MPDSPDDPMRPLPGEGGENAPQAVTPAENISASNETQSVGQAPRPRRRRRRRPRQPRSDQPAAEQPSQAEVPAAAAEGATSGDGSPPAQRRRRRRRRGPRPDVGSVTAPGGQELQPAESAPRLLADLASPVIEAGAPVPETLGEVTQSPAVKSDSAPDGFPRRRRRRRWGPRPGATSGSGAVAGETAQATGESEPAQEGERVPPTGARSRGEHQPGRSSAAEADRGPRIRGPRQRRGPGDGRPDRRPQDSNARERGRAGDRPGSGGGRFAGREREPARDRDRSGRAARRGKGRDEAKREPERRLYALESVVDRGFEDVSDEAGNNEPRRVHWTIIKRMVADQNSGKAISAVYVLRRDDIDTEFPSLGTARAAANKTIIHPEKLTLSKAEHAAAKGDGATPERNRRQR